MNQITFQSTFDTPTVKMGNLNELGCTPDGRIWEYLKTTEIVSQYMVVANPANTNVDTVSSSENGAGQVVFITEAAAGWTVGDYEDHWILIDDGTGEGQLGKVKSNVAATLELYVDYAFGTDLDVADSDMVIRHHPDAEKTPVTTLLTPMKGVAQVTFASGDYGWFLKRGIGGVLGGAAMTINTMISPGDNTEGTAITIPVATGDEFGEYSVVGRVLVANANADKAALVDINIR